MLTESIYVSIIVPVYNEEENVHRLHERIDLVLKQQSFLYEVIYVDDGSTDNTFSRLKQIAQSDSHVQVIRLKRNFGQTAAMSAGVAQSTGSIFIFMDGDLQNDPIDIPRLLTKLEEGYDVVSGWRKNRQDAKLSRKLPSFFANRLISKVTGVYLHDYGCTLKAYRREVFQHVRLYGEMHRFIPAFAFFAGAKIAELQVSHHPRQFGKSKYNISRTIRVLLDLVTVKFLGSFGTKPLYAFGIPGVITVLLGGFLSVFMVSQKVLSSHNRIHKNPLLPVSMHVTSFGMQSIMMGLVAELLMRTYYESQHKPTYIVQDIVRSWEPKREEEELITAKQLQILGERKRL